MGVLGITMMKAERYGSGIYAFNQALKVATDPKKVDFYRACVDMMTVLQDVANIEKPEVSKPASESAKIKLAGGAEVVEEESEESHVAEVVEGEEVQKEELRSSSNVVVDENKIKIGSLFIQLKKDGLEESIVTSCHNIRKTFVRTEEYTPEELADIQGLAMENPQILRIDFQEVDVDSKHFIVCDPCEAALAFFNRRVGTEDERLKDFYNIFK